MSVVQTFDRFPIVRGRLPLCAIVLAILYVDNWFLSRDGGNSIETKPLLWSVSHLPQHKNICQLRVALFWLHYTEYIPIDDNNNYIFFN